MRRSSLKKYFKKLDAVSFSLVYKFQKLSCPYNKTSQNENKESSLKQALNYVELQQILRNQKRIQQQIFLALRQSKQLSMKYPIQTSSKESIQQSQSQSIMLKPSKNLQDQKNGENTKIQNDKEQNAQKVLNVAQRTFKFRKIEDLLAIIGKSKKSEKQKLFKLFSYLSFQLHKQPHRILDVKPTMRFISNLIEFTKKTGEKQDEHSENPIKVCKVFLNSLFYMLMLIISGGKDQHINEPLRQKLFNNKTFLKHLLAIDIYAGKEVSKIYVMIVKHVYRNHPSKGIRKSLFWSIVRNLGYFNQHNSKSALNLVIILNEQKFLYRLKQHQVRQYNLIQTTENIFHASKQFPQAVQVLKYYMYLVYEYPQLAVMRSASNSLQQLYVTECLKKYVMNDSQYQKNYLRYIQHTVGLISDTQLSEVCQHYFQKFLEVSHWLQEKNNLKLASNGWVEFLLNVIQICMKTIKNDHTFLWMVQNGLIRQLVQIFTLKTVEKSIEYLVIGLIKMSLKQAQLKFPHLHWGLLNFVYKEMKLGQMKIILNNPLKKSFYKEVSSKIENLSTAAIELE